MYISKSLLPHDPWSAKWLETRELSIVAQRPIDLHTMQTLIPLTPVPLCTRSMRSCAFEVGMPQLKIFSSEKKKGTNRRRKKKQKKSESGHRQGDLWRCFHISQSTHTHPGALAWCPWRVVEEIERMHCAYCVQAPICISIF